MERLTFEGNFCDIAQCRELPCPYDNNCMQKQVWERLRDYEDAGLSPKACAQARKIEDGLNADDYSIDRMVELMKADKEGRMTVFPCKGWLDIVFGEQILFYGIDADYIEEPIREISVDNADRISWYDGWKTVFLKSTDHNGQAWEFYPIEIGKTVFLTREEAEKALEARNGDQ